MDKLIRVQRFEEADCNVSKSLVTSRLKQLHEKAAKRTIACKASESSTKRAKLAITDNEVDEAINSHTEQHYQDQKQSSQDINSNQKDHSLDENTGVKDGSSAEDDERDNNVESSAEAFQYVVLGKKKPQKTSIKPSKLSTNLPEWITNPVEIKPEQNTKIDNVAYLDAFIKRKLRKKGINELFPVQDTIIRAILKDCQNFGLHHPTPVRDICISAPTGSGKTLAYALPLIQALLHRGLMLLRALVLVPTADLAYQVKKVFDQYNEGSGLRVGTAIGQQNFKNEQSQIVDVKSGRSNIDILIATPGRLIDHINSTEFFTLEHLRFLVLDEADKFLTSSYHQLIALILKSTFISENDQQNNCPHGFLIHRTFREPPMAPIVSKCHRNKLPLQKLLFSATLSYDPEKLASVELFFPILYQLSYKESQSMTCDQELYVTPAELKEHYIICGASEKPLAVIYFMLSLKYRRVLCFTNSRESTKRLSLLLSIFGGIRIAALSSDILRKERKRIISKFSSGEIDILICSDAVARGIDIQKIEYIINYDVPNHIKTYVHRVGRTARAGLTGVAYTLLHKQEAKFFKLMLGKKRATIKKVKIASSQLEKFIDKYKQSLEKLEEAVKVTDEQKQLKLGQRIIDADRKPTKNKMKA